MKNISDIRISVIVPVYNAEPHLRATLDALAAQTFEDFELILVNDGSQDRSHEICREYQTRDPDRITVLDGPNQGVSRARSRGLDAARGSWIAFCDADDRPEPRWLEVLLADALRDNADLSCCAFHDISPDEQKVRMNFALSGSRELLEGADQVRRRFLLPLFSGSPSVHGYLFPSLFRRDLIEKNAIRFTPGVSMKEDELFYMDYLSVTDRISATNEPLYRYIRSGETSATARHRKADALRREENWLNYTEARLNIFRKHGFEKAYPALEKELLLRFFAHKVQKICCEKVAFSEKRKLLRETARLADRENLRAQNASGTIFLLTLRHCPVLLPPLFAIKQRRECRAREDAP